MTISCVCTTNCHHYLVLSAKTCKIRKKMVKLRLAFPAKYDYNRILRLKILQRIGMRKGKEDHG